MFSLEYVFLCCLQLIRVRVFSQANGGNTNALQFLNVNTLSNDDCANFLGAEGWRIGPSSLCTLTREGQGICGVRRSVCGT